MKIAIIDNSSAARKRIRQTVQQSNPDAQITEFADAESALGALPGLKPNLITLEILMPRLRGLLFIARLREMGVNSRIVLVTNETRADILEQYGTLGVSGIFEKPFSAARLQEAVANHGFPLAPAQKRVPDERAIVAITNENGRFTYVSDGFCALVRCSREELLTCTYQSLQIEAKIGNKHFPSLAPENRRHEGPVHLQSLSTSIVSIPDRSGAPLKHLAIHDEASLRESRSYRVLLASPEALKLGRIVEELGTANCAVELAETAAVAVAKAKAARYDLILMDCTLPPTDGFEATRQIRANQTGRDRTPVVALSSGHLAEDRFRGEQVGMDDFLARPLVAQELRLTLAKWLPGTEGIVSFPFPNTWSTAAQGGYSLQTCC